MTSIQKWSIGLTVFLAVMGYLVGITGQLTDLGFDPVQIKRIIALFTILLGLGNTISVVLQSLGLTISAKQAAISTLPITTQIAGLMANSNGKIKQIETTPEIANSPELAANEKVISK